MHPDLFAKPVDDQREAIGPQAVVLRGFALPCVDELLSAIDAVAARAPFRQMQTRGGFTMSVAMTNCGRLGWTTSRRGYRYTAADPESGLPWPDMPATFAGLARDAATAVGFNDFEPDACLINRYRPGARMSLHQDSDERDLGAPIVSVSLGMDATFLFGGHARADRPAKVLLQHGDVVVWGGEDRLRFHGVAPLKDVAHPRLGAKRINLTFRSAG